ncbi:MAG: hypothetical protein IPP63_19360 [Chloracidobacterium sp.]|nr:hypothetical protein [Chloracidobacterium sp.]
MRTSWLVPKFQTVTVDHILRAGKYAAEIKCACRIAQSGDLGDDVLDIEAELEGMIANYMRYRVLKLPAGFVASISEVGRRTGGRVPHDGVLTVFTTGSR